MFKRSDAQLLKKLFLFFQSKKLFSPAFEDGNISIRHRTPHDQSTKSGSNRSVLKVYMANQLELNEAEMEEYEEVVNELAQQLEEVTKIKDELTNNIIQLHNEKDDFIKIKTHQWEEEKSEYLTKIQGLEFTVAETNTVKVQKNYT